MMVDFKFGFLLRCASLETIVVGFMFQIFCYSRYVAYWPCLGFAKKKIYIYSSFHGFC